MTSPLIHSLGTASLTLGSTAVTGTGTAWAINAVAGGMFSAGGVSVPIASVEDDTSLTLAYAWPGETVEDAAYAIVLATARAADTVWATRRWTQVVGNGLLSAIQPDAAGTAEDRDALDPPLENGKWFALCENDSDEIVLQLKVPEGWRSFTTRGLPGLDGPGITWRGAWAAGEYAALDAVENDGSAYVANTTTTEEPPHADWDLLAAAGAPGGPGDPGDPGAPGADGVSFIWRGAYNGGSAYAADDVVSDQDSSWIALQATTGNAPPSLPTTSNAYWELMAAKGADGAGSGSVTSVAMTVPTGFSVSGSPITGAGTFAVNYAGGYQGYTSAEATKLGHLTVTQAVDLDAIETRVNALDAAVVLMGSWDASAGTFPGSGTAQAGASYIVSVAGTVDGIAFAVNDRVLAITDNASTSTYAANWLKLDYTDQVLSVAGKTGAVTLAQADISGLTTASSPQFAGLNLGHASDTPITRVSAGVAAIDGHNILTANLASTAGLGFVIDEDDMASDSASKVPTQQSVKAYVDANAGGGSDWTELAPVATTSGTSFDWTSLPAGINEVEMWFIAGVNTNGTSPIIVQIGTGGSPATSGYVGGGGLAGAGVFTPSTAGFPFGRSASSHSFTGRLTLKKRSDNNVWVASHAGQIDTSGVGGAGGGTVTLAGSMDIIRVRPANGTDTFNAGAIQVRYRS
jgi:hypothetical protein